jgi:hypothetical protein
LTEKIDPSPAEFTVYSRRGCHLCEILLAELDVLVRRRARIKVLDIDDEPEWQAAYSDRVPVVCYDGRELCHYHLDAEAVISCLNPVEQ